jgi:hypothetical protein
LSSSTCELLAAIARTLALLREDPSIEPSWRGDDGGGVSGWSSSSRKLHWPSFLRINVALAYSLISMFNECLVTRFNVDTHAAYSNQPSCSFSRRRGATWRRFFKPARCPSYFSSMLLAPRSRPTKYPSCHSSRQNWICSNI